MDLKRFFIIGALSTGVLTGCGSDSDSAEVGATYRGSVEDGSISVDTKDGFQAVGIEVAKASVASEAVFNLLPNAVSMGPGGARTIVVDQKKLAMIKTLTDSVKSSELSNLPAGVESSEIQDGTCTGVEGSMTASSTYSESDSNSLSSGSQEGTYFYEYETVITFVDYCSNGSGGPSTDGFVINGSIVTSEIDERSYAEVDINEIYTEKETEKYEFKNLTLVSVDEENETIMSSVIFNGLVEEIESSSSTYNTDTEEYTSTSSEMNSQEFTMKSGPIVATYSSFEECSSELEECIDTLEFTALDGKTYRLDDGELDGSDVEGTVFDATLGSVSIEADNLAICFDEEGNVQLETGYISLIDSEGTELEIEVEECGVYSSELVTPIAEELTPV